MSPPPKPSLFNKPSWSNPQAIGDAENFFHRSNQSYVGIAAEAERKRARKQARKQHEQRSGRSLEGRPGKRRRLSDDSENDSSLSSSEEERNCSERSCSEKKYGEEKEKLNSKIDNMKPSIPVQESFLPDSLSRRYEDGLKEPSRRATDIIDLEDYDEPSKVNEDEEDDVEITVPKVLAPPEEDDFPASDEEYPELARKAREKARKKHIEADVTSTDPIPRLMQGTDKHLQSSQLNHQATPPVALPAEPVIQILVSSSIPDTKPLIVCRKLTQRLKDVRLAWCERQGFAADFVSTVFLTWRGRRLFDVTTCKSLGIGVNSEGDILQKGQKDIIGEEHRQIHMEAMTEKILADYQKAKRRNVADEEDEEAAAEEEAAAQKPKEAQVRIILKAKGFEDFKLIVKPVRYLQVITFSFFACILTCTLVHVDIKNPERFSSRSENWPGPRGVPDF